MATNYPGGIDSFTNSSPWTWAANVRAVGYGVAAYLLHWLLLPFSFFHR